jgi:hypothetical protein
VVVRRASIFSSFLFIPTPQQRPARLQAPSPNTQNCRHGTWPLATRLHQATARERALASPSFFILHSLNRFDPFSYYITMADDPNWCLDFDFDDKK